MDSIIKKNPECDNFQGLSISIPRSVVLCTDIFDRFMAENRLYPLALSDASDAAILAAFLAARLPENVREDLLALLDVVDRPLAVRSSSLLEDSHYQPFAGIYATYMIPYTPDVRQRLHWLTDAIKGVYASVFYANSKSYMTATSNVIDQEKMAVIIQEVAGKTVAAITSRRSRSGPLAQLLSARRRGNRRRRGGNGRGSGQIYSGRGRGLRFFRFIPSTRY